MQDYIALRIDANPCNETITDLLAAFLCDVGYESSSPDEKGLTAYIKDDQYKESDVTDVINEFPIESKFSYKAEFVKGEDALSIHLFIRIFQMLSMIS